MQIWNLLENFSVIRNKVERNTSVCGGRAWGRVFEVKSADRIRDNMANDLLAFKEEADGNVGSF